MIKLNCFGSSAMQDNFDDFATATVKSENPRISRLVCLLSQSRKASTANLRSQKEDGFGKYSRLPSGVPNMRTKYAPGGSTLEGTLETIFFCECPVYLTAVVA